MNSKQITNDTPIAFLTVGQLLEIIELERKKQNHTTPTPKAPTRLAYGLIGIRNLFGVSHATAYRYKETIIKEAVSQHGRKIIIDVDKALELYKKLKP